MRLLENPKTFEVKFRKSFNFAFDIRELIFLFLLILYTISFFSENSIICFNL